MKGTTPSSPPVRELRPSLLPHSLHGVPCLGMFDCLAVGRTEIADTEVVDHAVLVGLYRQPQIERLSIRRNFDLSDGHVATRPFRGEGRRSGLNVTN